MTGVLKYTLVVRNPDDMSVVALLAGQPVPSWAAELVGKEDFEGAAAGNEPVADKPPKNGAGSSREAWAEYANIVGATVDDDMERADIIAAVEAAEK